MDDELLAAIAELRAHGAAIDFPMDHMTDAEVLEGVQQAMTSMPESTMRVVKASGLPRVVAILPLLISARRVVLTCPPAPYQLEKTTATNNSKLG
jgi:hypothetical protein